MRILQLLPADLINRRIFGVTLRVWMPLALAVLGASLAMIGPGAWSLDARLFGRKQIEPDL